MATTTEQKQVESGQPIKLPPKWKREWRILRRVGLRQWIDGLRRVRRFHKSVDEMRRQDKETS